MKQAGRGFPFLRDKDWMLVVPGLPRPCCNSEHLLYCDHLLLLCLLQTTMASKVLASYNANRMHRSICSWELKGGKNLSFEAKAKAGVSLNPRTQKAEVMSPNSA